MALGLIGLMRAILLASCSVNHRLPSAPAMMLNGLLAAVGMRKSETVPPGVTRPMRFPSCSTNQTLPSGPSVALPGPDPGVGMSNGRIGAPLGLIFATLFRPNSVAHRLPSDPLVMPRGAAFCAKGNSSMAIWPRADAEKAFSVLTTVSTPTTLRATLATAVAPFGSWFTRPIGLSPRSFYGRGRVDCKGFGDYWDVAAATVRVGPYRTSHDSRARDVRLLLR